MSTVKRKREATARNERARARALKKRRVDVPRSYIITRDASRQGEARVHYLSGKLGRPAIEIYIKGCSIRDSLALRGFLYGFNPKKDTVYWRCPQHGLNAWWEHIHQNMLLRIGCTTDTYVYNFNDAPRRLLNGAGT